MHDSNEPREKFQTKNRFFSKWFCALIALLSSLVINVYADPDQHVTNTWSSVLAAEYSAGQDASGYRVFPSSSRGFFVVGNGGRFSTISKVDSSGMEEWTYLFEAPTNNSLPARLASYVKENSDGTIEVLGSVGRINLTYYGPFRLFHSKLSSTGQLISYFDKYKTPYYGRPLTIISLDTLGYATYAAGNADSISLVRVNSDTSLAPSIYNFHGFPYYHPGRIVEYSLTSKKLGLSTTTYNDNSIQIAPKPFAIIIDSNNREVSRLSGAPEMTSVSVTMPQVDGYYIAACQDYPNLPSLRVSRYDLSGKQLWSAEPIPGAYILPSSLRMSFDGNILVCGILGSRKDNGSADADETTFDGIFLKVSSVNGEIIWQDTVGVAGEGDRLKHILEYEQGRYIVTGGVGLLSDQPNEKIYLGAYNESITTQVEQSVAPKIAARAVVVGSNGLLSLHLESPDENELTVSITDVIGHTAFSGSALVDKLDNCVRLDLRTFHTGIYSVSLSSSTRTYRFKVLKSVD